MEPVRKSVVAVPLDHFRSVQNPKDRVLPVFARVNRRFRCERGRGLPINLAECHLSLHRLRAADLRAQDFQTTLAGGAFPSLRGSFEAPYAPGTLFTGT